MTTLHLGVADLAYSDPDAKGAATTGEVATILEKKYHVMRVFLEQNEAKIGDWLVDAMKGVIENMMAGKPLASVNVDLGTKLGKRSISGVSINGKIEERFRDYLALGEWQQTSGQSIAAADRGRTLRRKSKKGPKRVAFIDTGLYQAAFRAWVT